MIILTNIDQRISLYDRADVSEVAVYIRIPEIGVAKKNVGHIDNIMISFCFDKEVKQKFSQTDI